MPEVRAQSEEILEKKAGGFNYRKLFSDVAVYSGGNLAIKALSLISAPIFTRLFNPAQYGAWSYINVTVTLITGVLLLGGDSAYTRFYFQCESEEEKKSLTVTWFSFLALWALVALACILPFTSTIVRWMALGEGYRSALTIGLASTPLLTINLILGQALRNTFRARDYTIFNLVTAVLTIILGVLFVAAFKWGVAGAVLGAALAAALIIPFRLWTVRKLFSLNFAWGFIKKLLKFGLPLVPMNIAFWLFSNGDRLMLARLASLEEVGLYSIAGSMAVVLMVLQNAVGQSWQPHGIKVYEEDQELAASVFRRTLVLLLAGAGFVITGFVALAQEVLFIIVPPAYYGAFAVVPYLAAGFLFFTGAHVFVVAMMVKNKTVYIMFACWLVALLNLGLNRLLIPILGLVGAGLATACAYLIFALSYALISVKLMPVRYPGRLLFGLTAVPLVAIILITLISYSGFGIIINLGLKLLLLGLCGLVLGQMVARFEKTSLKALIFMLLKRPAA